MASHLGAQIHENPENASQEPSKFEAFFTRAPGAVFGAHLEVPELENGGKSMFLESKSVPKWMLKMFVFLALFFQ